MTSLTYVVSNEPNVRDSYTATVALGPFLDVVLQIYINGVLLGEANTNFAANGGLDAPGKWLNNSFSWNSGSASSATIEIRQKGFFAGRGYDFGLDNISLGGSSLQSDAVPIGPVTDCSTISATASACVDDIYTDLTATVGGGLTFSHWELKSNPGVVVSTSNPFRDSTTTQKDYVAVGFLAVGNKLVNGDFNAGNVGFISGSATAGGPYYNLGTLSGGGTNEYNVFNTIPNNNGFWTNIPQAPGQSAGSLRFVADAKANPKVIAWDFTATANEKFAFSGYMANVHSNVTGDTVNSGIPAAVGVFINNIQIAAYYSKNDRDWHLLAGTWTAPSTGTFRLEVRDLKLKTGGGNDFALDNFVLSPSIGITKTAEVKTPLCNPCITDVGTIKESTFCNNTGIVGINPSVNDVPTVQYDWYTAATGGTKLGSSIGNNTIQIPVGAVPTNGSGNKVVYYEKEYKAIGTVLAKNQLCNSSFTGNDGTNSATGDNNYQSRFVTTKPITLTEVGFSLRSELYNNGDSQTGTITFRVVGSQVRNGALVANTAVVYGNLTGTYSRTRTSPPQRVDVDLQATGNVDVPAGTFFIYPVSINRVGSGEIYVQRPTDCAQPNRSDNIDGTIVTRNGMSGGSAGNENDKTGNNNTPGYVYNVKFGLPAVACPRIPVILTPKCPCTKPQNVTITASAVNDSIKVCQGTAVTLTGTALVTAAALNTNFYYSWLKKGTASPLNNAILAPIPANTTSNVPNNTSITGTTTQSGMYYLRVEDGNTGNNSCATLDSIYVEINPTTVPGAIAANQTICSGGDPGAFTSTTAATGGNNKYAYQWQRSLNGGTTWANIAGATLATFNEGIKTNTTTSDSIIQYRRNVTSGACPLVSSAAINLTVNPIVANGIVAGDQTVCSGGNPVAFTQTTATSGGNGTYNYQWQRASNATGPWTNIASTNSTTYDAPAGITATSYYRRLDVSGFCAMDSTNIITVTVPAAIVPGKLSKSDSICFGTIPSPFTGTAATGGAGTYSYQWLISKNGTAFSNYGTANATNVNLTYPDTLRSDRYFVRQVTSGSVAPCNVAYSDTIRIKVVPPISPGGLVNPNISAICEGTIPSLGYGSSNPTGGFKPYTYQWQDSIPGGNWTNITTATNSNYTETRNLDTTTYYRRIVTAGICGSSRSNIIVMPVTPTRIPAVSITANNSTICTGTSITFTATPINGGATPSYQWQKSINGTVWNDISGQTNSTYTTTTASNNDQYRVVMTSNELCPVPKSVNSNAITITVTTVVVPTVTISPDKNPACQGASVTFTTTAGNGGSAPTFEWFINGNSQGAATTTNTFSTTTLANSDIVSAKMISNSGCANPIDATSTGVTMTINPNLTPNVLIVESKNNICENDVVKFTATPTNGGTNPTYQWLLNGSNISGATDSTFSNTSNINNGAIYSVVLTSSESCLTTTNAPSNPITITVLPTLVPSVIISPNKPTICSGGSVLFTATPTNGGTAPSYQWKLNGVDIAGETGVTFNTTTLTNGQSVTVELTSSATCANPQKINSNSVAINVLSGIGAGTIGTDQEVCFGGIPATINEVTAASGVTSAVVYTWVSKLDNGVWTPLVGTGNSYNYTSTISDTTLVRRIATDASLPGPCNTDTTTTVKLNLLSPVLAGHLASGTTICSGTAAPIINDSISASGGKGPYTYAWEQSLDGSVYSLISGSNATLSPGILNVKTWFRRIATSSQSCGSVTSAPVIIDVIQSPVPKVDINVSSSTICSGASAQFIAKKIINGGAQPIFSWKVNGVNIPSITDSIYNTVSLVNGDKVSVNMTSNAVCANPVNVPSSEITMTVLPGIGAGTIGNDQDVCAGNNPATITELTAPTGVTAAVSYSWQYLDDNGIWTDFSGATSKDLTFTAPITKSLKVKRITADNSLPAPCNKAETNVINLNLLAPLTAGAINTKQTICAGQTPSQLQDSISVTGGKTPYTYSWEQSNNGVWSTILGATAINYQPTTLSASTSYRRKVTSSNGCGSATSNEIEKQVTPITNVTVSINNPGQTCVNVPMLFTATPTGGGATPIYKWFLNNVQIGTNSNSLNYTPLAGDSGKVIKVELASSDVCNNGPSTSNLVSLQVVGAVIPKVTIASTGAVCAGTGITYTAVGNGGGSAPTFQWFLNNNPVGTNSNTFTLVNPNNLDAVWVVMTSNLPCVVAGTNPVTSTKLFADVRTIPKPVINEANSEFCAGSTFTYTVNPTSAGNRFQWYKNGVKLIDDTLSSLIVNSTGKYFVVESNRICSTTSDAVAAERVENPIAFAGNDQYVLFESIVQLGASGGSNYSWAPATDLNNALIPNPVWPASTTTAFTVTVSNKSTSGSTVCSNTDEVEIFVLKPIIIPNAISPNNDGKNDDWFIENIEGFPNCEIDVYNRYGALVWKSTGYNERWAGINFRNGELLPQGTYFYVIDLKSSVFKDPYKGYIQILK